MAQASTDTSAENGAANRNPPRKCYYLVDKEQSAQLQQYRYALRGLSQLAHNPHEDMTEGRLASVDGAYLASLFDLLDDHMGMILAGYTERTHWKPADPARKVPA